MTYLDRFDRRLARERAGRRALIAARRAERDAGGHVRVVHPGWAPGCTCDECQAVNVSENDAQRDSA